jgi:predicted fused transcriptional regulator/phosphomethylpyrimidine kinase
VTEAEFREFMREMIVRFERQTAAHRADLRLQREEMRRHFEKQDRKIDEIIAEGRAGREALFRILDKLDGRGAAPAT